MKKICEYTGEYCENAGNEPCIGCPIFEADAIGDVW